MDRHQGSNPETHSQESFSALCVESIAANNCADYKDNDLDNLIDCQESSCVPSTNCPTVSGQEDQNNFNCADQKDNDYDGKTDCMDSGCFGGTVCFAESAIANSNTDYYSGRIL